MMKTYDDDILCSDDNRDEDFVHQTPAKGTSSKRKLSILFSKTIVQKKKKQPLKAMKVQIKMTMKLLR